MSTPVDPTATLGPSPSVNPYSSAHNLQAFIQLVYLKTANNVLVQNMGQLEDALSITNNVLNTLTGVQTLKNDISVNSKGTFNFNYSQSASNYSKNYTTAASAFFGTPVTVSATLGTASTLATNITNYFTLRNEIKTELSALLPLTPTVTSGTSQTPDPTSLYAKLQVVYQDMTKYVSSTATSTTAGIQTGIKSWIVDNYNSVSGAAAANAGDIQQNLTNAITAGQSLNTTQAQSVQNYLYIFQEYYKSASSLLTAINTIVTQMANAIKG
jgi:hypothetical protein